MPKTLAELRSEGAKRPERRQVVTVGRGSEIVAELESAQIKIENASPRANSQGAKAEIAEHRDHIIALSEQLAEYQGEVLLRATMTDGDWWRWCDQHPPRDSSEPGHGRDLEVTAYHNGLEFVPRCNVDDLIATLDKFVVSYEDEALADGDLDALGVMLSDRKALARRIVGMYETDGPNLPKWRQTLSGTSGSGTSSS